jgi:hypothetical protein
VVHRVFHTRDDSGAALIIAIGIMTVLLVIALSFFQITREEMKSADNYSNSIQADMLADGAIAMATAFLQHDELIHPTYTSFDHAWRSYFNGTWAGGKAWAWPVDLNDINTDSDNQFRPTLHKFPPLVNLEAIDYFRGDQLGIGRLDLRKSQFIDQMYIPRIEDNSNLAFIRDHTDFYVTYTNLRNDIPMVLQPRNTNSNSGFASPDVYVTGRDTNRNEVLPFLISSDWARPPIMNYSSFFGLNNQYTRYTKPSDLNAAHQITMSQPISDLRLMPVEQIHFFSDVDLDSDGYHDAIWIPISADTLFPNDGLDNDLDGFVDAEDLDGEPGVFMYRGHLDGADNDGDGFVDELAEDNRGNIIGDGVSEEEVIVFTMPIDKMFSIYIPRYRDVPAEIRPVYDVAGSPNAINTFANDLSYQPTAGNAPLTENPSYVLNSGQISVDGNTPLPGDSSLPLQDYLYSFKDDDYSGIVNDGVDARRYVFNEFVTPLLGTGSPTPDANRQPLFYYYQNLIARIRQAKFIIDNARPVDAPSSEIRILGEPVSDIVSRVAILITDEASKANINEAGGRTYLRNKGRRDKTNLNFPNNSPVPNVDRWPLFASLNMGRSPAEYELSTLPNMSRVTVDRMWNFRTGAPGGIGFASFVFNDTTPFTVLNDFAPFGNINFTPNYLLNDLSQSYYRDVSLPGYGRVDDNANAFLLAFNGIDDDGDSLYYQTDGIDNNLNNLIFEGDGIDNDGDGVIDEQGEGVDEPGEGAMVGTDEGFRYWDLDGDGQLDDLPGLEGIDEPSELQRFRPYRHFIAELESVDDRNQDEDFDGFPEGDSFDNDLDKTFNEIGELGDRPFRTFDQLTLALDLDRSFIKPLAPFITAHSTDRNIRHLHQPNSFGPMNSFRKVITGQKLDYNFASAETIAKAFLEDWNYIPTVPFTDTQEIRNFAAGLRQEDTNVYGNLLQQSIGQYVTEMYPDPELRANQLAANIKDFVDTNHSRTELIVEVDNNGTDIDPWLGAFGIEPLALTQEMYYTQTGVEDIRINEIMVRPVRRFEAEALTLTGASFGGNSFLPIDPGIRTSEFDPNRFSMPLTPDFDFYVTRIEDRIGTIINNLRNADIFYRTATNADFTAGFFDGEIPDFYWGSPSVTRDIFDASDSVFDAYSLMGIMSAWTTYESTYPLMYQAEDDDTLDNDRAVEIPNIIQFSFKASPQLPPGRYYLTMNSLLADNGFGLGVSNTSNTKSALVNTVTNPEDFAFFFRIGKANQDAFSSDFSDLHPYPAAFVALDDAEQEFWVKPAVLGYDGIGNQTGMAFLQASSIATITSIYNTYHNYTGYPVSIPGPGFSIEIPEIGDVNNPNYLHVAVWRTRSQEVEHGNEINPLAINYFEFSQEPDHEYVELAHIDPHGEPVDLSNWILAVENMEPPVELIIPNGTTIAPGGYLLLSPNVRDDFSGNNPGRRGILQNGMGLAKTNAFVSVPPTAPPFIHNDVVFGNEYNGVADDFGSVFNPPGNVDFIDNNGDGLEDDYAFIMDPNIQSSPHSSFANERYDRLIQMIVPDIYNLNTAVEIGELVLRGGVFPNYPERDGIDNDGDRFYLESDGMDNDGDFAVGYLPDDQFIKDRIDESRVIDMANEAIIPNINAFSRYENSPNRFLPPEGIDEGRWRRFNPDLTFRYFVPGAFSGVTIPLNYRDRFGSFVTLDRNTDNPNFKGYLPDQYSLPRWKEFLERRLFPGENVIITLYEAPRSVVSADTTKHERIVDRVTYTERDVVNRNIDDLLSLVDGGGYFRSPLHIEYENMWPEDTMGIDFYRSLERKHPFYNGDRFGKRNRFQVTDGDYDDWSESTGLFQRINLIGAAQNIYQIFSIPELDAQFDSDIPALAILTDPTHDIYRLFAHAYHGSPLRMNLSQRRMEDPVTDRFTGRAPEPPLEGIDVISRGQFNTYLKTIELPIEYRWPWLKPRIPNKFMTSPGELMTMSHFETNMHADFRDFENPEFWVGTEINAGQTQAYNFVTNPNAFTRGITYYYSEDEPVLNNQIMLSHWFRDDHRDHDYFIGTDGDIDDDNLANDLVNDLHAVVSNAASTDTLSLHVGTADAFPLSADTTPPLSWSFGDVPPEEWSPLFLFELAGDSSSTYPYLDPRIVYDVTRNGSEEPPYLLDQGLFLDSLPNGVDTNRWPQNQRAVLFTSQNSPENPNIANNPETDRDNYNSATRKGASAYFVWDGNDGLENGEYDLFIGIAEPLNALHTIHTTYANLYNVDVNTVFGNDFVTEAIETDHEDMLVDIEIFTDKDGNGSTWIPTFPYPRSYTDLNSGSNVVSNSYPFIRNESLSQIQDVIPDIDGFVHYGPVRIDNNHLGVFIRNRANTDVINRFTRVVLTPRNKTPGRININTTMSKIAGATSFDDGQVSNPLMGLPGTLLDFQKEFNEMGTFIQEIQEGIGPPNRGNYTGFIFEWLNSYNPDFGFALLPTNLNTPLNPLFQTQTDKSFGQSAAFRSYRLTVGRPEHPDGRYYEHISDLIKPITIRDSIGSLGTRQPNTLSEFSFGNLLNNDSENFDESYERFRRTANLITTRSNVFEIKVRVQSGYVTDVNGDGILNYRDDNEFTVTGEKDARAIYER